MLYRQVWSICCQVNQFNSDEYLIMTLKSYHPLLEHKKKNTYVSTQ